MLGLLLYNVQNGNELQPCCSVIIENINIKKPIETHISVVRFLLFILGWGKQDGITSQGSPEKFSKFKSAPRKYNKFRSWSQFKMFENHWITKLL